MTFRKELEQVLNKYSIDSMCGTPDFILAEMVEGYLLTLHSGLFERDKWHTGSKPQILKFPPIDREASAGVK